MPRQTGRIPIRATTVFRIHALPADTFAPLSALDDDALRAHHARRVVADESPGFPCRVSLQDAQLGESLLLLHYWHHDADSPYRASGPIFVREGVLEAIPGIGEVPLQLRRRLLSVRGYTTAGTAMRTMTVIEGERLADTVAGIFADPAIDYLHIHNARPGCYAARVTRA